METFKKTSQDPSVILIYIWFFIVWGYMHFRSFLKNWFKAASEDYVLNYTGLIISKMFFVTVIMKASDERSRSLISCQHH